MSLLRTLHSRPRLAAIVACLALEILTRVVIYRPADVITSKPTIFYLDDKPRLNPGAHGDQVPGRALWSMEPGRPYSVAVSRDGFRASYEAAPTDRKILVLGDSYAFGAYLSQDDTWPVLLDARLRNIDAYSDVRVFNAAVAGYGMREQLDYLADKGIRFKPDLVVFHFQPSAIDGVAQSRVPRPTGGETVLHTVARQSAVVRTVNAAARDALLVRDRVLAPPLRSADGEGTRPQDYELFTTYFVRMHQMLKDAGIPLAVVSFPTLAQLAGTCSDATQEHMLRLGARIGVPVLDLGARLREFEPSETFLVTYVAAAAPARPGCFPEADRYTGPAYPSRFGNQVATHAIAEWLRTTSLLAPRAPR